jgi:RNA polymerase sigma-70 factor (ECF subfamily)
LSFAASSSFDQAWKKAALLGEPEAVQRLAAEMLQPLYAFCYYRVGRLSHLCEEVVQETFLQALQALDAYDPQRAQNEIFLWLTGLARNCIRRALARERRQLSFEQLWQQVDAELLRACEELDQQELSAEALRRSETQELVSATLAQLSPRQRTVLEGKYLHGLSVRELAVRVGETEKAIESLLSRARASFRAVFITLARGVQPQEEPQVL